MFSENTTNKTNTNNTNNTNNADDTNNDLKDLLDFVYILIPIYVTYLLYILDKFRVKIRMVDSNMSQLVYFLSGYEAKVIASINTNKTTKSLLKKTEEQFKKYIKEMNIWRVILNLVFCLPPKYHQCLEEINFIEDKLKYTISNNLD